MEVSQIFVNFVNENLVGNTVTFIPTAALPDKLDFHINYSKELLSKMLVTGTVKICSRYLSPTFCVRELVEILLSNGGGIVLFRGRVLC